jgi:hypothetical protein
MIRGKQNSDGMFDPGNIQEDSDPLAALEESEDNVTSILPGI